MQVLQTVDGQPRIAHQTVTLGARALIDGRAWVAVEGLPEGSRIVGASAGALREGTRVEIAADPAAGAPSSPAQ
ncbi:hypothetical protein ACFQOZ_16980 [Comamonas endophytica]